MRAILKDDDLALSVVIPSLNEAANLKVLLPELRAALGAMGVSHEILVVDGDSPDGTASVVESAGATYICERRRGYGTAILRGVAEARGAYVLTMDADLSHPVEFLRELWNARTAADITIASRYVTGAKSDQPWLRGQLSRLLNAFFAIGLSFPAHDMSSGFRLYRKQLFQGLDLTFSNFVVLVEILLKAYAKGMHIQEAPFHYRPRQQGKSNARVLRFGLDYLRLFHRMWGLRNSVEFPDYDWRAYDSRIPLQRYWQRRRHRLITGWAPRTPRTLDVGCGSSRVLASLPQAIGLDLRHDKLLFMRRTNRLLVRGDGCALPFPDKSFDCVVCSQVIEHIPNENGRCLDELVRVLAPGGILVLGTPDYGRWEWRVTEKLYAWVVPGAYAHEHVTRYTHETLREALAKRGLEVLEEAYIGRGELIVKARKCGASQ